MTDNKLFDIKIKEEFSNFLPEVKPHIWQNIISKKEQKKPFLFWLSILNNKNIYLLLLAICAGSILLKFSSQNNSKIVASKRSIFLKNDKVKSNTNIEPITSSNIKNILSAPKQSFNIYLDKKESPNLNKVHNKILAPILLKNNVGNTNKLSFSKIENFNTLVNFNKLQKLDLIVNNTNKLNFNFELQKNNFPKIIMPGCPIIEKNAAGNKTYFEIYFGPDKAFRSLSDTGSSTYLQKRKESSQFSSAYSVGLHYSKIFNNGVSFKSGLNYSQIIEKFSFTQGNLVQVTYIIDVNGDTTGSYVTTGSRFKTTYNKYKTLDVPILVGYELGNGKLHTNISAGVNVNLYSWQKGDVLDGTLQPINITTGKSTNPYQFKTNVGLGFIGSIGFYYKLSGNIHILAEPYFRYNLTPMSKDVITFKQKYNTMGLHVGLRFDIH